MTHFKSKPLYEKLENSRSLHQHDNYSSTFLLEVVPCPLTFLFASTSTHSLIHLLTKYKLFTV